MPSSAEMFVYPGPGGSGDCVIQYCECWELCGPVSSVLLGHFGAGELCGIVVCVFLLNFAGPRLCSVQ